MKLKSKQTKTGHAGFFCALCGQYTYKVYLLNSKWKCHGCTDKELIKRINEREGTTP